MSPSSMPRLSERAFAIISIQFVAEPSLASESASSSGSSYIESPTVAGLSVVAGGEGLASVPSLSSGLLAGVLARYFRTILSSEAIMKQSSQINNMRATPRTLRTATERVQVVLPVQQLRLTGGRSPLAI